MVSARRAAGALLVVASVVSVAACSSGGDDSTDGSTTTTSTQGSAASGDSSLGELATRRKLLFGAAVSTDPLRDEPKYRNTLAREFNAVTPENAMKWDTIHPEQDRYDFEPADEIVEFAQEHDMAVRGHTLVWYRQVPDWVAEREWTRAELEDVLRDHIRTVVGRYRGKVAQWDVVNEAVDDHGELRDTVWLRGIGPEYIDLAFRWAHEADPDAELFYNDYDIEHPTEKSDAVEALVSGLQSRGAPIDGVGIQGHELTVRAATPAMLAAALSRYTQHDLDVAFTEVDVGIFLPAKEKNLEEQAAVYRDMLDACLAVPRCTAFVTWGFTDEHSWIPTEIPGFGDALPFDTGYRPKPALAALRAGLADRRSG